MKNIDLAQNNCKKGINYTVKKKNKQRVKRNISRNNGTKNEIHETSNENAIK